MVQLFVSDIDGCLSEPYDRMDLPALVRLADYVDRGGAVGSDPIYPAFSICSGRPLPYVECLTQMLGIRVPVLFESGGGMFDPRTAEVIWSPLLTDSLRKQLDEVEAWMIHEGIPGTSMVYDYAKRTQAGVIGPDHDEITACIPRVQHFVDANGFDLLVQPTHLSIDVVATGITKEIGLDWLADTVDISTHQFAYIGDSIGDLAALQRVGHSFAPENAIDQVKSSVDVVTPPRAQGVLKAVETCILKNQQKSEFERTKR